MGPFHALRVTLTLEEPTPLHAAELREAVTKFLARHGTSGQILERSTLAELIGLLKTPGATVR